MRSSVLHFAIVLAWVATANQAAAQAKRKVTPADYGTFSTLSQPRLSPDGKWATYHLSYDSGADTLFLQNTATAKRYAYPSAGNSRFSTDGKWFAAITPTEGLSLRRLSTAAVRVVPGATHYQWDKEATRLVLTRNLAANPDVLVLDFVTGQEQSIPNATDFVIGAKGHIALLSDNEIRLLHPGAASNPITLIADTPCRYKKLLWNKEGTSLAFLEELPPDGYTPANHRIWSYTLESAQWRMLDPSALGAQQRIISPLGKAPLVFAPDSGGILFYRSNARNENPGDGNVEVWDSMAQLEFPEWKYKADVSQLAKLSRWFPDTNEVKDIATNDRSSVLLLAGLKYGLGYDKLRYEPNYTLEAPADLYITDLKAGKTRLLLERQEVSVNVASSPNGRYISYYREGAWWIYDVESGKHANKTRSLDIRFYDTDPHKEGQLEPYGSPGWSSDESYLLVYDKYDIWLLSANTEVPLRITHGREAGIRYRICESHYDFDTGFNRIWLQNKHFDLANGVVLEARGNDMKGGYFFWKPHTRIRRLHYGDVAVSGLQKAADADVYVYIEQTAVMPPRLMVLRDDKRHPKLLLQSNPQQQDMQWASSGFISFTDEAGNDLKGILYYPAGFDPKKKYPMIVYVYERLSQDLHQFLSPAWNNSIGFNPANYSLDGYLVLLPDIAYTIGEPGRSAVGCVAAAVNAVAAKGILQRDKVGLIGHSFGGYEVSYIITQTPIFAAAVAGAGITDLVSNCLAMHGETEHSNMWRYESQQFRMGGSIYDNFAGYIANSPITHADRITTPLLSWTGKSDNNVPATQSMELHLALRRLQKKNILLVYPNEGHTVLNPANQLDLNKRIKQWFDSFLKGN
jgi:dipeptidyl aminopeptidase/acylaminoacyl peptidase